MTARTERLKEKMLSYPYEVCVERARYWTESHKQTAGMPEVIRNAKALENVLEKMTIYINDGELVVGCRSSKPKATPLFPEVRSAWIEAQLNTFENRPIQSFFVSREVKKELRKILPYWRGKSAWDRALHLMSKETQMEIYKIVFTVHAEFANGIGHFLVGHDNVLRKGLNGIVKEAEERLESASGDAAEFLKAVIITCRAAMNFSKRYASLAENMAEKESNPARKEELKKIAEACRWIPDNPPRSFYEALQCICLVHHICQIECGGFAISVGRLDPMLYPYYRKDLDYGKITREHAQELMECLYIKLSEIADMLDDIIVPISSGPPITQNITVGGQTGEGNDATNEISHICLDALASIKTHQPNFSVRVHRGTPDDFLVRASEAVRDGTIMAFFNDDVIIDGMVSRGYALEDARNYGIVGCVEPGSPGLSFGSTDSNLINVAKCLELALNNGNGMNLLRSPLFLARKMKAYIKEKNHVFILSPLRLLRMLYLTLKLSRGVRKFGVPDLLRLASGKRLGPETGDPRNFKSFDELMDAYRKQVEYFVEKMVIAMDACDRAHAELKTTPFISFAIEDCIKSGKDVTWGGARYNFTGPQAVGVADVADSLAAVKKFVFDERIISMGELLDALHSDFDGKEHLRQMLLEKAPKYGNDDDYVDSIARESASVYFKAVERHKNFRGGIFQPGIYSMSAHLVFGVFVGATPDGRRKGDPLTEGVSPVHGRERSGPTAVMASVAKIDHRKCSNGNVLNMKFSPSALERDADIKNFVGLNRTYFELGGSEVQYNVISAGVLREAQRNPEKYRGLVVRVAGYSALFTELDIATQNDIIGRMEHGGIIKAAE